MFAGTIRQLEPVDSEAVERILDLYWSGEFRNNLSQHLVTNDLDWIVAEENDEIVGVAASRKAPERIQEFTKTDNVVEFYISAVKYKGKGIGTALRNARIDKARNKGFKEAVFFSGGTHQDSWDFHDNSEFKRVGDAVAPDGEKGKIWLMDL
ncbi:MAG: GNAT family N-acetyltransferase [Candidatus Paceibacterota bacterium]